MKRKIYALAAILIFFCSIHVSASGVDDFNPKNYVYDDNGTPLFVKVYIKAPKTGFSQQSESASLLVSSQNADMRILNSIVQDDQRGSFIVIPIKKKKYQVDDEERNESVWECPYCGTINESFRNTCKKKGCVLYR